MRSPQEQDDFLEHGRFDERRAKFDRPAFSTPVTIGLVLVAIGFACIGIAVLFGIGTDDGGPFLVMGFIVSMTAGAALFLWALVRKLMRR
jgi:uncharacterized membrane protein YjjP (DUF1212 family)